jgi:long-subunit acyl-CoA synthetase (AMP-forming)
VGKIMAGNEVKLSEGDEGEILMKSPFMFSKYAHFPLSSRFYF